ncbi:MAG TPA: glycosyltransferase family 39 protein [Verrucomicrobiae bacterium]|jgi:Dolichyl-phosphate-mannose-protein mannosyltransferase|nr:glycosyltransferase family 39 protein [Verrucomicrobiae bacterium]
MSEVSTLPPRPQPADALPRQRDSSFRRFACYFCVILTLTIFAGVRFHFRNMPLERDEGEYAYMGQLLLHGIPPYKLAYTMKLPGTCMAYAAMMAVFGETPGGIRLGMIFVTTLCAILVFLLGKKLSGLLAGTIAGIVYPFLAIRPGVLGMDGHATHFVVLFAVAGILVLLRAMKPMEKTTGPPSKALFFLSGLSFGIAFLMKQPGILFGIFAGLYWLWHERRRGWQWSRILLPGLLFSVGVILPYALTCLWLWRAGVFAEFWFWTWSYARAYGSIVRLHDIWPLYLQWTLPWAIRPFVLWEIALAGLAAPLWSRYARPHGGFVAGLSFASVLAVSAGFYFRPHYFIMLLPVGAICIGIAVEYAQRELLRRNWRRAAVLPLLFFVISFVLAVRGQWKSYFHLPPLELSRRMYDKGQSFPEDVVVANFIAAHAHAGDEIGVIGSEPEICFYTHLHCATSYIYMYPLMEKQRYARRMQAEMMQQLSTSQPRFIVYVDYERSWGWKPTLDQNRPFLDEAWNFAHLGYQLVDQVPAVDERLLDPHSHDVVPNPLRGERAGFYVFQR